jgi:hypothetical protein
MDGQRSGAFKRSLGQAASGLEQGLASLQSQYGLQQQQLGLQERGQQLQALLSLLGIGLQPRTNTFYQPGQQGLFGGLFSSGGQAIGASLPLLLGLGTGGSALPFMGAASGGTNILSSLMGRQAPQTSFGGLNPQNVMNMGQSQLPRLFA